MYKDFILSSAGFVIDNTDSCIDTRSLQIGLKILQKITDSTDMLQFNIPSNDHRLNNAGDYKYLIYIYSYNVYK
jgi:hypothetical protein